MFTTTRSLISGVLPSHPAMRVRATVWGLFALGALSGCAGLSGLDGSSSFQCAAPSGVPCQSVTGVHANEKAGNLPAQRLKTPTSADRSTEPAAAETSRSARTWTAQHPNQAAGASTPVLPALGAIRSDPTVIRIWVAPWEDLDGDLNDQSYVYLQIDSGRWLIEHNRERIRREFTPVAAPTAPRGQQQPSAAPTGAAQPPRSGTPASAAVGVEPPARNDALTQAIAEGRRRAEALNAAKGAGSVAQEGRP
jgi:conjugal transfer pilus assembly protein TraV